MMATRITPFVCGEYYHIYNRGNSKQIIFIDNEDRERFLKLLYLYNSDKRIDFREDIIRKNLNAWEYEKGESILSIGAWVLMPNHFHLYLTIPSHLAEARLPQDLNAISDFMQRVLTSYSKYFNTKHKRSGSLFEGKFKSTYIENDPQAKYLFSYIHLNPIKLIDPKWKEEGVKNKKIALEYLNNYKWSSYHDYRGLTRQESRILNKSDFPDYFSNKEIFDKDIFDWLSYSE